MLKAHATDPPIPTGQVAIFVKSPAQAEEIPRGKNEAITPTLILKDV